MFTTLVESRAVRPRRTAGTMASIVIHGALLTAIVAVAVPKAGDATEAPEVEVIRDFVVVRPPEPQAPIPRTDRAPHPGPPTLSPTIVVPPTSIPTMIVDVDVTMPAVPAEQIGVRPIGSPLGGSGVDGSRPGLGSTGVIDANVADRVPAIAGNAQAPLYPNALRASGVTGRVTARFVIDTTGRVELNGLEIMDTSHPLFSEAVRSALARYRFTAGEYGGRKVRTMVMMPFVFTLR